LRAFSESDRLLARLRWTPRTTCPGWAPWAPPHAHPGRAWAPNLIAGAAYLASIGLAGVTALYSVRGMVTLFPGTPVAVVCLGVAMEAAKLAAVAFLARHWGGMAGLARVALVVLVAGLAAINAAGVYSQLVGAHLGDRVAATSAFESESAALAARTEVQSHTVADLDMRLGEINAAIVEMTKRGRVNGALDAIAAQRKARGDLVAQRRREADTLAALKAAQAAIGVRAQAVAIEAAPIRYVAGLFGATTEQAIRLLILLMVICCDPMAIALTGAAAAR